MVSKVGAASVPMGAQVFEANAQKAKTSSVTIKKYHIQVGDTLSHIAKKFNVLVSVLQKINKIKNINRIYAGEMLLIPIKNSSSKPNTSSPSKSSEPSWLKIARTQLGVSEKNNPKTVSNYLKSTNIPRKYCKPSTPWCAAFTNWALEKAGYKTANSAWSADWLKWGKASKLKKGALVIVQSARLHTGFYIGTKNGRIQLLAGNSGANNVRIGSYLQSAIRAVRWPFSKD